MKRLITLMFINTFCISNIYALSVVDDSGQTITLAQPAQRIISLAPSLTEMVFTAGAQEQLVATVKSSNYPVAANNIARVGDYQRFNMETLLSFKPDLILAWSSGNNRAQLEMIKKFNIQVYQNEPRKLTDIAKTIRNIGILTGHTKQAGTAADDFLNRLAALRKANQNKTRLNAFYQIWHEPIYTINGKHVISQIMQMCGLDNIFSHSRILAPKVNQEAVIDRNPDIIIASGMSPGLNSKKVGWLGIWQKWPVITAVAKGNLFFIPPDLINRQSSRILDGAEIMCQQADKARKKNERP